MAERKLLVDSDFKEQLGYVGVLDACEKYIRVEGEEEPIQKAPEKIQVTDYQGTAVKA